MKTYRSILLVKVDPVDVIIFKSFVHKTNYLLNLTIGTFELSPDGNSVNLYKYMVIDPKDGFVLSRYPMTYGNCVTLIDMYL